MKKIVLALVGCGLAIGQVSAENEATGKGKGSAKRPGGDGSFFKKMDTDGDQAISKSEAGEHWAKMSQRDADKDGKVTTKELMAGRTGASSEGAKRKPGEFFKRSDKNSDGKLTEDEVPAEFWARISAHDKDKDGAVTQAEIMAGMAAGGGKGKGGADMFARADKNKDGKISKGEVPAEAWAKMGKLDKDGDDAVSKAEMAAMMRGAGKGKGKGGYGDRAAGGADAIFAKMDEDKDGKLSSEEVPAEMWSKLSKADSNADGLVSKAELEKVYAGKEAAGKTPDKAKKKRPELEKESA